VSARSQRSAALLLALTAGLGACGEGASVESQHQALAPQAAPLELLRRSIGAVKRIPFQAIRRYEAHAHGERVLAYREDVFSDGRGGFAIDALEVVEPRMDAREEELFLLLQDARAEFYFAHRDFAIRDERLFLEQWQVTDRGQGLVAGRTCTLLDVRRQERPERSYHLAVDGENGMILRVEERGRDGERISLLEYETLDLSPEEGRELFRSELREARCDTLEELAAALGFAPAAPKLLPPGYVALERAAVDEPVLGSHWARFTFSDGVDELFFLHQDRAERPPAPSGAVASRAAGAPGGSTVVRYLEVGPWSVVFGDVDGRDFVAAGKLSPETLRDVVESAFF
jgi:hypothetical protein